MNNVPNTLNVELNSEGYLTDTSQWSPELARLLATEEGITLSDRHMAVITYLRQEFEKGTRLTIRRVGKSGVVTIKEFYNLFPGGPLKKASRIAGIPKPTSCV